MWPRDARDVIHRWRRRRAVALRAVLCAVCLWGGALVSKGQGAAVGGGTPSLRERDVKRAEKVLEKLRLLGEAGAAGEDGAAFRGLARKFYPGLFITVADMRPTDLKTDLDTAVFLYAEAGRAWSALGDAGADCERERPDLYAPLCLDLDTRTARRLLLAKARLHARWAEAVVKAYRGAGDEEAARLISEMEAARARDALFAASTAEALKALERMVNTPATYGDYLERPAAVKVSFEKLDAEFADALGRAGVWLGWMSRGPAYYHLSAAWRSYRDGLFWHRKVHASKRKVVSAAAGFAGDPLRDIGLDADHVGYAVVANWKVAAKYTRLAERSLPGISLEK